MGHLGIHGFEIQKGHWAFWTTLVLNQRDFAEKFFFEEDTSGGDGVQKGHWAFWTTLVLNQWDFAGKAFFEEDTSGGEGEI